MADTFDLIVIGAGSGGLTAGRYARRLGAKVALVEKHRIGGDCTWTGCVPSKALLKAAKVAHAARTAAYYGIATSPPVADLPKVRGYVYGAIQEVYQHETPEGLAREGIEVVTGAARFLGPRPILAGERKLTAQHFILATGAHPVVPPIPGLQEVPFMTYEQIFDNERLPARLLILGAGPIGVEIAQAYQRLGSQVTLVGVALPAQRRAGSGGGDEQRLRSGRDCVRARKGHGSAYPWEGDRPHPSRARGARRDVARGRRASA